LQEQTLNPDPKKRFYPFKAVEGFTDNTAAPEVKKSGYGNVIETDEKPFDFQIEAENIGIGYWKNIRRFRGQAGLCAYWIDTTFIGGQKAVNGDFLPFDAQFDALQPKAGVKGGEVTKTMINLSFKDEKALSDNLSAIVFPIDVDLKRELFGVTGVELSSPSPLLGTVKAVEAISKTDLYDIYADALAVPAAWKAIEPLTGAVLAITTVTKNPTLKAWNIDHAGAQADVTLASPEALAALNVGSATAGGFEAEQSVRLGE
jgi:hypothetical protein